MMMPKLFIVSERAVGESVTETVVRHSLLHGTLRLLPSIYASDMPGRVYDICTWLAQPGEELT